MVEPVSHNPANGNKDPFVKLDKDFKLLSYFFISLMENNIHYNDRLVLTEEMASDPKHIQPFVNSLGHGSWLPYINEETFQLYVLPKLLKEKKEKLEADYCTPTEEGTTTECPVASSQTEAVESQDHHHQFNAQEYTHMKEKLKTIESIVSWKPLPQISPLKRYCFKDEPNTVAIKGDTETLKSWYTVDKLQNSIEVYLIADD